MWVLPAWEFANITGDGASATLYEEKTTSSLTAGNRYRFINEGGGSCAKGG